MGFHPTFIPHPSRLEEVDVSAQKRREPRSDDGIYLRPPVKLETRFLLLHCYYFPRRSFLPFASIGASRLWFS